MRESKLSASGWGLLEEQFTADGDNSVMLAWLSHGEDAVVCLSAVKLMLKMLRELQFRGKALEVVATTSSPGEAG